MTASDWIQTAKARGEAAAKAESDAREQSSREAKARAERAAKVAAEFVEKVARPVLDEVVRAFPDRVALAADKELAVEINGVKGLRPRGPELRTNDPTGGGWPYFGTYVSGDAKHVVIHGAVGDRTIANLLTTIKDATPYKVREVVARWIEELAKRGLV